MTSVFLVRGDFCKPRPFSLKARPALVPHSQRGWRGHPCTRGLQPSVSLPAGVRPYVHPTPAPAASNNPLVLTPCSTPTGTQPRVRRSGILHQSSSPAQERCSHPLEQGTLSSPDPNPSAPRRVSPRPSRSWATGLYTIGNVFSTKFPSESQPSLPSGHLASPLLTARLPHCDMAGGPRLSLRTLRPSRGQPCSGRRRLCTGAKGGLGSLKLPFRFSRRYRLLMIIVLSFWGMKNRFNSQPEKQQVEVPRV